LNKKTESKDIYYDTQTT